MADVEQRHVPPGVQRHAELTYTLQASPSLLNWPNLSTNLTDNHGVLKVDDVTVTHEPQRYHRFVWP